jgi:DHA1 family multidrug resistance protein-like MFS transporter
MKKERLRKKNFKIFVFSNSLLALAIGLFGPFYYIFINDIGGSIENFGIAAGLLVLSGALFSLFAGKFSDKIGRKPFLVIGAFASAIIVFLYTIINSTWQLYLLQIFSGIITAGFETAEGAYLGDLTDHNKRGEEVGRYDAIIGIFEAGAIFIGGFLAGRFGFKLVFYIVSFISLISAFIMLKLREK